MRRWSVLAERRLLMAMTPENMAVLDRHIQKFRLPYCPVCQNKTWDAAGLEMGNEVNDAATSANIGGPALPVVILVCTRCFYVMQFAWLPLKNSQAAT